MTRILLLDTATRSATLVLGNTSNHLVVRSDSSERNSRDLMALVREAFSTVGGLAATPIDAVGFNRGPGSYTGSRLAASVVQGIAYVKGCPVIELNTLELLYFSGLNALGINRAETVDRYPALVAVESKVGEYFWTVFDDCKQTSDPRFVVGDADALLASCQANKVALFMNASMQSHERLRCLSQVAWLEPRIELALGVAERRLKQGDVIDALHIEPLYGQNNIGWLTLAEQRAQQ